MWMWILLRSPPLKYWRVYCTDGPNKMTCLKWVKQNRATVSPKGQSVSLLLFLRFTPPLFVPWKALMCLWPTGYKHTASRVMLAVVAVASGRSRGGREIGVRTDEWMDRLTGVCKRFAMATLAGPMICQRPSGCRGEAVWMEGLLLSPAEPQHDKMCMLWKSARTRLSVPSANRELTEGQDWHLVASCVLQAKKKCPIVYFIGHSLRVKICKDNSWNSERSAFA